MSRYALISCRSPSKRGSWVYLLKKQYGGDAYARPGIDIFQAVRWPRPVQTLHSTHHIFSLTAVHKITRSRTDGGLGLGGQAFFITIGRNDFGHAGIGMGAYIHMIPLSYDTPATEIAINDSPVFFWRPTAQLRNLTSDPRSYHPTQRHRTPFRLPASPGLPAKPEPLIPASPRRHMHHLAQPHSPIKQTNEQP
jgi:hypothetical protein